MRVAKVAALISRFFTTSDRVLSGYEGRHSNGSRQNSTRLWPSPLLSATISTNIRQRHRTFPSAQHLAQLPYKHKLAAVISRQPPELGSSDSRTTTTSMGEGATAGKIIT